MTRRRRRLWTRPEGWASPAGWALGPTAAETCVALALGLTRSHECSRIGIMKFITLQQPFSLSLVFLCLPNHSLIHRGYKPPPSSACSLPNTELHGTALNYLHCPCSLQIETTFSKPHSQTVDTSGVGSTRLHTPRRRPCLPHHHPSLTPPKHIALTRCL